MLLVSTSEINSYAQDTNNSEINNNYTNTSEIISISDTNLKRAINSELGKSDLNSPVTKLELESLNSISSQNGSNKDIKSLSGLEYATNLESIDLSNNNIVDISSIKNLFTNGKLKSVNLSNQIIDLGVDSTIEAKYKIYNNIYNIYGNQVAPSYISDSGKYLDGNITWDKLENFKDYNLYYSFDEKVNKDGKSLVFSGKAYKYLQVGGDTAIINSIPTIKASNKTIRVGDKFNPLKNVSAYDKEDGDITNKIKVEENNVNNKKVGTYEVTYSVTDSQGAKATKTIKVYVKKKEENNNNQNNNENNNQGSSEENNQGSNGGSTTNPGTNEDNNNNGNDLDDNSTNEDNKDEDKNDSTNNEIINTDDSEIENNKDDSQNQEQNKEDVKDESSFLTPVMMLAIAIFGIGMGVKFMNMK